MIQAASFAMSRALTRSPGSLRPQALVKCECVMPSSTARLFISATKLAAPNAFVFQLDGRTLKPLQTSGSTATLEGTKVEISPVAAPLLNKTFNTNAVKAGLLVGIAKIVVNTTAGQ